MLYSFCPDDTRSVRLDELLRRKLPDLVGKDISNSKIRRLIIAGAVRLNGTPCRVPGAVVRSGWTVSCSVDESKLFYEKPANDISFDLTPDSVLYEDDSLIIVNKPAFFPVEAGMVDSRDNLHDAVIRYLEQCTPGLRNPPYVGIMHRLDHGTSGAILFTKTRIVNAAVHEMFENRMIAKVYRAVVRMPLNKLPPENFSVEMYMGRISPKSSAAKWGLVPAESGGVFSHTDFVIAGRGKRGGSAVLFIDAHLGTGRTHQIRVHLSSRGLPLVGDTLYGGIQNDRIMLHSATLSFLHPVSGMRISVCAPLPEGFGPDLVVP